MVSLRGVRLVGGSPWGLVTSRPSEVGLSVGEVGLVWWKPPTGRVSEGARGAQPGAADRPAGKIQKASGRAGPDKEDEEGGSCPEAP